MGTALEEAWAALGGDPGAPARLAVTAAGRCFGGRLDCDGLLRAGAGSALLAAAELATARGLHRPAVGLDGRGLALAAVSERHAAVAGRASASAFAPLSRFVATADGHVRLHANYPHHRAALLSVLGADDPVAAARSWPATALEDAVVAAGGCAAAVRTPAEWAGHPQAGWLARTPLVTLTGTDRPAAPLARPTGPLPAAGLRVLDLTRVIAGPVATRMLAALGADVLRIGHPGRPELPLHVVDGLVGKRAAVLDLGPGRDRLHELLAEADVLVSGYRPGALDRFGLDPEELADRHPHLVDVRLSAWGDGGPWGSRRGFDSLVQAATGIAVVEGSPGEPGALPAQALDHGTGLLAAAAALRGLTARARGTGPRSARLALARTAGWLLGRPAEPGPTRLPDPAPWLLDLPAGGNRVVTVPPPGTRELPAGGDRIAGVRPPGTRDLPAGGDRVVAVRPPGTLDGRPLTWLSARTREDADEARW